MRARIAVVGALAVLTLACTDRVPGKSGSAPAGSGALHVSVNGLPPGLRATAAVVTGPGFSRNVAATTVLSGLAPGSYAVQPQMIQQKDGGFVAAPPQPVEIAGSDTGTVRVDFTFEPAPTAYIDNIVDSVRAAYGLPAMGGGIVTLNTPAFAIGVGGLRRDRIGLPVTKSDLWHLGSNSKALTATLAAIAVDSNHIQWTTTIGAAFPELASATLAEYRDVTLRDLLAQSSGFPRDPPHEIILGTTRQQNRAAVVQWAVRQAPVSRRGAYFYSNMNFMIAAAMIERAMGEPFESAIQKHVFKPLGMNDVGFGPQAPALTSQQPVAHAWRNGGWVTVENADNPPVYASAGGAHMSLGSWMRFAQEVLRIEAGTPTIVSVNEGRMTTAPITPVANGASYGFGWFVSQRDWAGGKALDHNGSNTTNSSFALVAPSRKFAVLMVTNSSDHPGNKTMDALHALGQRLIRYYETGR